MELKTLKEVKNEAKRFLAKLEAAEKRLNENSYWDMGCKETGAVRRAALDLKNELTKITRG